MSTDDEWAAFDPGFDHGHVELRESNVEGAFRADKLKGVEGADVRMANIVGQIGDESFDWSKVDTQGADVRSSNCRGQQLGSANFDWSAVGATAGDVLKANLPNQIDAEAFDGIDHMGADVRKPNCTGTIGDAAFKKLVADIQSPLTPVQTAWRLGILPLLLALPIALSPVVKMVPTSYGPLITGAIVGVATLLGLAAVFKKITMVKQGELCLYAPHGLELWSSHVCSHRTTFAPRVPQRPIL